MRQVVQTTTALRQSKQLLAVEVFEEVCNWGPAGPMTRALRMATRWWAGNMIVTNIPGPQFTLYLLGAPLRECYPLIPFFSNHGL